MIPHTHSHPHYWKQGEIMEGMAALSSSLYPLTSTATLLSSSQLQVLPELPRKQALRASTLPTALLGTTLFPYFLSTTLK